MTGWRPCRALPSSRFRACRRRHASSRFRRIAWSTPSRENRRACEHRVRVGLAGRHSLPCGSTDGTTASWRRTRGATHPSGRRTSSRSSSRRKTRPASTSSSRSIRSARSSTPASHSPDLCRATMRVETAWDCAGFEARVTPRTASLVGELPRFLCARCARGRAPARWRANFYRIDRGAVGRVLGLVADLRGPGRLPRPGAVRRPDASRLTERSTQPQCTIPCSWSQSAARSLARRSLNWKKCVSSFGCCRRAARNASAGSAAASAAPRSRRQPASSQCAAKSSRSPRDALAAGPWAARRSADPPTARRAGARRGRGPARRLRSRRSKKCVIF